MFDLYHPSNTIRCGNPYYHISARVEGSPEDGKFTHHIIAQDPNAPGKIAADAMTATERQAEWNRKVKLTMEAWYTEAERECHTGAQHARQGPLSMELTLWRTFWNQAFPEDHVDWYKPYKGMVKSLNTSPYVYADSGNVWWRSSHGTKVCSQQKPCQICERTWTKLPQQRCEACNRLCCIICIITDINTACKVYDSEWHCKECMAIEDEVKEEEVPPWRHSGLLQNVEPTYAHMAPLWFTSGGEEG